MTRLQLIVRNIGWACLKSEVISYFKKFGTIHNVSIPLNLSTGFNKNFAILTITCDANNLNSLLTDYHMLSGYELTVAKRTKDQATQKELSNKPLESL